MKGKVAFVFGAAVGYVLGSRAGRERYEQIKRGAQSVWATAPVQRGVEVVREVAQQRVDTVKAAATRAGKSALSTFLQGERQAAQPAGRAEGTTAATDAKSTPAPKSTPASEEGSA